MSLIDVLQLMQKNRTKILAVMVIFGLLALVKAFLSPPSYISTIYFRSHDGGVDFSAFNRIVARATEDVLRADAICGKLEASCQFDTLIDPTLGQVVVNVRSPSLELTQSLVSRIPAGVIRENESLGVTAPARRYKSLREGLKRTQLEIARIQHQLKRPVSVDDIGKQRPALRDLEELVAELMFVSQEQGENQARIFDMYGRRDYKNFPGLDNEDQPAPIRALLMFSALENLYALQSSAVEQIMKDDITATASGAKPDQKQIREKKLLVVSGAVFGAIVAILFLLCAEAWRRYYAGARGCSSV